MREGERGRLTYLFECLLEYGHVDHHDEAKHDPEERVGLSLKALNKLLPRVELEDCKNKTVS